MVVSREPALPHHRPSVGFDQLTCVLRLLMFSYQDNNVNPECGYACHRLTERAQLTLYP